MVAGRFASVTQVLGGRENRAALRREHPGTGDQHLVGPDGEFRRAPAGAAAGVGPQLGAVFEDVPVVAGEHHDAAGGRRAIEQLRESGHVLRSPSRIE